jgi:hypothetical protein
MSQTGLKHMLMEVTLDNNSSITWRKYQKTLMHVYKAAHQTEEEKTSSTKCQQYDEVI